MRTWQTAINKVFRRDNKAYGIMKNTNRFEGTKINI